MMGPCGVGKSSANKPVFRKYGFDENTFLKLQVDNIISHMRQSNENLQQIPYFDLREKYGADTYLSLLFEVGISRKLNLCFETTGQWLERHDALVDFAHHNGNTSTSKTPSLCHHFIKISTIHIFHRTPRLGVSQDTNTLHH